MTTRHSRVIAFKGSLAALALIAVSAGAAGATPTTRFEGSCAATGKGTFVQPAGFVGRPGIRFLLEGVGWCTGRLNDRSVTEMPVSVLQDGTYSYGGCSPLGHANARTKLRFDPVDPDDPDQRPSDQGTLDLQTTYLGSPVFLLQTANGGMGTGFLTAFTQRQPPGVVQGCLAGTAKEFAWEMQLRTLSALYG